MPCAPRCVRRLVLGALVVVSACGGRSELEGGRLTLSAGGAGSSAVEPMSRAGSAGNGGNAGAGAAGNAGFATGGSVDGGRAGSPMAGATTIGGAGTGATAGGEAGSALGGEAGSALGGEAGSSTGAPPDEPATGIVFSDVDQVCRELSGKVTIQRAKDERDIDGYALYFGASPTQKLRPTPIAVLRKTGGDVSYMLANVPVPEGASYLLAYSRNAAGEAPVAVAVAINELFQTTHADISAGQGARSGYSPWALIDPTSERLLVATNNGALGYIPGIFRCDFAGAGCTYKAASGGSGGYPSAAIDFQSSKLLIATQGVTGTPSLSRCSLDGSGCQHIDLSVGEVTVGVEYLTTLVDAVNGKLLIVTQDDGHFFIPSLFRCNLDGTSCQRSDLSAGQGRSCGWFPSAVIDTQNAKLLVTATDYRAASYAQPAFFRCNLDGTGCSYRDISAGKGQNTGLYSSIALDDTNAKLLVVTEDVANLARPGLFRCDLDGSACTFADISAGQPLNTGVQPKAVIDRKHAKLLVVAENYEPARPGLFRCELDGTACAFADISTGLDNSGIRPSAVITPDGTRLLVVAENADARDGLFTVCLQ